MKVKFLYNLGGRMMKLVKIPYLFTIAKVDHIEEKQLNDPYCFIGKTDEELSIVCMSNCVPNDVIEKDEGWKGFRIDGILDFSLIGILAPIASILSQNQIGIFVVSTYNTDYVFIKEEKYEYALDVLKKEGYEIDEKN